MYMCAIGFMIEFQRSVKYMSGFRFDDTVSMFSRLHYTYNYQKRFILKLKLSSTEKQIS